ncbi:MetQ/NlpA family ABC transporter substrate-binding protein [Actinopolymorpha alba]|uniref:MetQ/NlpA family ABC transporter substrate-binding protein n=1 Tax=Actinopolymorpha alba TaxID=533267 RepID=UPI001ED9AF08|nr:MetQ/NlpA family ABC transporter substrate-binding protein [Actinopolymorpha alba]
MYVIVSAGCGISFSVLTEETLRVGVSPGPDRQILTYVKESLAPAVRLNLEVVEFADPAAARSALREKSLDVAFVRSSGGAGTKDGPSPDLAFLAPVHVEPLGLYSAKVKAVRELPSGGEIVLPDTPGASGRALQLLAAEKVLSVREGAGDAATVRDITSNPHHLRVTMLAPTDLVKAYPRATLAVMAPGTATQAGLRPRGDALSLEAAIGSPYADGLLVRAGDRADSRVTMLAELLRSPQVRTFIEEKFQQAVLPAF